MITEGYPMHMSSYGSQRNGGDPDDGHIAASMETDGAISPKSSIADLQVDNRVEASSPLNASKTRYTAGRLSPSVRVSLASTMAAVGGVLFGYDTGQSLRQLTQIIYHKTT